MILDRNTSGYGWIDYFYLVRSRWPIVLLICSLVLLAGAAKRTQYPPLYEISLRIQFEEEALHRDSLGPVAARSSMATQTTRSDDLPRHASEMGGLSLLAETIASCDLVERWGVKDENAALRLLQERIKIEELPDGRSLRISARDISPSLSASLARTHAEGFLAAKVAEAKKEVDARIGRLERELKDRREGIAELESRLVGIDAETGGSEAEVEDLRRQLVSERHLLRSLEAKHQSAVVEVVENEGLAIGGLAALTSPQSAKAVLPVWLTIPGLVCLGLFAGILATAFSGRKRIEMGLLSNLLESLKVPIAGFAPMTGASLLSSATALPRLTECYRDLRTKLMRLPAGDCLFLTLMPLRLRGEIAEVVANLACVLADGGKTVLVIDADFRSPRLHRLFDSANHPGLSDFLAGEMRLEETVIRSRRANLWFMPSGPLHEDPCGLINGRRMGDLVWDMRSRFDFILLAAPSIHEVSDAGALASLADGTALVTPARGCSLSRLERARLALEAASAQLSAVFLTTSLEKTGVSVPRPAEKSLKPSDSSRSTR